MSFRSLVFPVLLMLIFSSAGGGNMIGSRMTVRVTLKCW